MSKTSRRVSVGIGLVFVLATVLTGTLAANENTLVVTSSEQRIDYANRVFVYKGQVSASWENITLEADEMDVHLTEDNTLKEIVAKGNVKVIQKDKNRRVTGESAIYVTEEDKLIMEGQVHYQDELGNDIQAHKMTIWITTERIEAEGTPVKATYVLRELEEE